MGRSANPKKQRGAVTPQAMARERVLRYLRLAGFGRRVRIHATTDHRTHWYFTLAVSSLEDPTRDFMYAGIIVEKETGFVYAFPSRARQPIDPADIALVQQGCTRITPNDLELLEAEVRTRRKQ